MGSSLCRRGGAKSAGRAGNVAIVGFDNISAVQDALKAGAIRATADQHADQLAVCGIEYALQIPRGEAAPRQADTRGPRHRRQSGSS